MRAEEYIRNLAAKGRYQFTTQEAVEALGGSEASVRKMLRRLKDRKQIASPLRSFHILIPPEYLQLGCPPAEHFIDQMMEYLKEPYYVGLLSAAAKHGASHQSPQALQVMVRKNRPSIECGKVRIVFIARSNLEQSSTIKFNTPRGYVCYATPEVTALELVGYPKMAAGVSNIATILEELSESMDKAKLLEAVQFTPVGWAQRLGYLLELMELNELACALEPYVEKHAHSYIPLRRNESTTGARRSSKWRVIINTEVEPDE